MKSISLEQFLARVQSRDPNQPEFMQAVREVMTSLWPFIEKNPQYADHGLLERLVEPERAIQFRISWVDDRGQVQVNRGFRIQHSNAIGPFKGGMRFHPATDIDETLKEVAVASRSNKPIGDRMIMNAAFLVERHREKDFDEKVRDVSRRYEELLTFKYTGPWPPYNFVNIKLKLEKAN